MRGKCKIWHIVIILELLAFFGVLTWYLSGVAIFLSHQDKLPLCSSATTTRRPANDTSLPASAADIDGSDSAPADPDRPSPATSPLPCRRYASLNDTVHSPFTFLYMLVTLLGLLTLSVLLVTFFERQYYRYHHNKIKKNRHLATRLDASSADDASLYSFIEELVHKTWIYKGGQSGYDAGNLRHSNIRIRHIYTIHNEAAQTAYQQKLHQVPLNLNSLEHELHAILTSELTKPNLKVAAKKRRTAAEVLELAAQKQLLDEQEQLHQQLLDQQLHEEDEEQLQHQCGGRDQQLNDPDAPQQLLNPSLRHGSFDTGMFSKNTDKDSELGSFGTPAMRQSKRSMSSTVTSNADQSLFTGSAMALLSGSKRSLLSINRSDLDNFGRTRSYTDYRKISTTSLPKSPLDLPSSQRKVSTVSLPRSALELPSTSRKTSTTSLPKNPLDLEASEFSLNRVLPPKQAAAATDESQQVEESEPVAKPPIALGDNELLLFHGTRIQNIHKICSQGFSLLKASAFALYGQGIYFTDSSQKADQYADVSVNRKKNKLAMLLCRVAIGNLGQHNEESRETQGQTFDTIIAGKGKRFRELVKFDPLQCYPAYVIVYDRIMGEPTQA